MKFLAILKDSLRETLDVKLFYVLVALSLIVVLLVASISYKPVPMERQVRFLIGLVNLGLRAQFQSRPETQGIDLRVDIEDFEQTDNRSEPWLGNYRFLYVFTLSRTSQPGLLDKKAQEQMAELRTELRRELTADKLQRGLKDLFVEVNVAEAPSDNPDEFRFQVTTDKGTRIKSRQEWFHEPSLFFGAVPIPVPLFSLGQQVQFIGDNVIGAWGAAITMLLSTILTASFIPSMLSKGTIDLLLAKPIHRVTLLLYKYLGGLLFMLLNTVVIMVGIWASLGLQTGLWVSALLLCVPIFTFQFAMFYAVSALVAVLTRSAIVSILAVVMTWGVLVLIGWTHWFFIEKGRADKPASTTSHWGYVSYDVLKAVLPRYKDIDWLTSRMIHEELIRPPSQAGADSADPRDAEAQKRRQQVAEDVYQRQLKELERDYGGYSWTSSLTVSSLFIAVMLGLACLRFATKDY
jgi:ABC-type transport system involved in multi-copper enzyme maturation permease subunit